ncbi:MAG: hypothetical protein QM662_05320 [Gordonia sp. (in: high G+C Gram-positive bacteria)]
MPPADPADSDPAGRADDLLADVRRIPDPPPDGLRAATPAQLATMYDVPRAAARSG